MRGRITTCRIKSGCHITRYILIVGINPYAAVWCEQGLILTNSQSRTLFGLYQSSFSCRSDTSVGFDVGITSPPDFEGV